MTTHDLLVEMNTRLVKMQQERPLLDPAYVNGYWRAVADMRALVAADVTVQPRPDRRASA